MSSECFTYAEQVPPRHRRAKRDELVITDARTIRALAHPARLAVLDALDGRELTATACAELTGLSPSAMSYHLRALEKWGIVERADDVDDGRQRPWRLRHDGLRIETEGIDGSGVGEEILGEALLDAERRSMRAFAARQDQEPAEWLSAADWKQASVWLTAEQARELTELVHGFIEDHRDSGNKRPANSRRTRITYRLIPIDAPPHVYGE
jgi:DNA-binding transcriptional ArsR family regulator